MNKTNLTKVDYFFEILIRIDHVFRYASVLVHLFYIVLLIGIKEFQKKSLVFVNHACIVNIFYCLNTFFFMFGDKPSFGNEKINELLCLFFEIAWVFSSYIRSYSILLIAIHRYIAAYNMVLYAKINSSNILIASAISIIWFISITFPLISKNFFETTRSSFMCLDGYSPKFTNTIMYFTFNYFFMIIGPTFAVVGIYISIIRRLKRVGYNVKQHSIIDRIFISDYELNQNEKNFQTKTVSEIKNYKKQKRFANQFALMCLSVIATSIILSIFTLRNIIPRFLIIFHYWRPIFRVYILSAISILPLIAIFYHPNKSAMLEKFKILKIKLFYFF